mmetsp:Transcript_47851/g.53319  ORF Transcript_47851/g.53319 Transcript_47851/m.53319 type:complete len:114 (+) Transcript_47851:296-637(+)
MLCGRTTKPIHLYNFQSITIISTTRVQNLKDRQEDNDKKAARSGAGAATAAAEEKHAFIIQSSSLSPLLSPPPLSSINHRYKVVEDTTISTLHLFHSVPYSTLRWGGVRMGME